MASTARTKEEEKEFFDSPQQLDQKITKLANIILQSKHFTVFTGAGISTSAGIPDFRSGLNTVLPTGVGAWAKAAAIQKGIDVKPQKKLNIKSTLNAIPTPTHMALVELNKQNILKYLISQNCDGLHRRSGYNPQAISELHGNTNLEFCKKCGKQYLRDFRVRRRKNHVHDHKTDRKCTVKGCGKVLYDTIINFNESLNDYSWDPAETNAAKSDCCLVLGSSLTVTPAANLPQSVGEKQDGKFCIVNLQKTSMDRLCDVRIYAKCDDVMVALMGKLKLKIPSWKLQRYIDIKINCVKNIVAVFGIDCDGTPYNILSLIKLIVKNDKVYEKKGKCLGGEMFKVKKSVNLRENEMYLELGFMGHYNEPNLMIDFKKYWNENTDAFVLNLSYDPYKTEWSVMKIGGEVEEYKNDKDDEKNTDFEDIYIGNLHELSTNNKTNNNHIWTMFVSINANKMVKSKTIKEIEYKLHPTFQPSDIIVKESPFLLQKRGWGTFEIDVKIMFHNNANRKDIQCSHVLDFDHPVTMTHIGNNNQVENDVVYSNKLNEFSI